MLQMTDLFDNVSVPHQRHSDTSVEAAGKAKAQFKGNLLKVLKAFVHADRLGLTDEQGCDALGMDGNSYRPSRVTLEKLGMVTRLAATRKTRSNRNAHIYTISMDGMIEASRYE